MIANHLIAAMVGIMLFFTVVVAPTVFKVLPVEWSSKYVRKFFPKYYASLGILTVISAFWAQSSHAQYFLIACAVLFAFTLFYLTGKINQAKIPWPVYSNSSFNHCSASFNWIIQRC